MIIVLLSLAVFLSQGEPIFSQTPFIARNDAAQTNVAATTAERQTAIVPTPVSELVFASEDLWAAGIDRRPSAAEYQRLRQAIENICEWARRSGEDLEVAEASDELDPALLYTRSRIYMIERSSCPAAP